MYADTMTGAGSRPMWPSRRGRTSAPGGGGLSSLRTQHTGGPYTAAPVAAELAALAWRSPGRELVQGWWRTCGYLLRYVKSWTTDNVFIAEGTSRFVVMVMVVVARG